MVSSTGSGTGSQVNNTPGVPSLYGGSAVKPSPSVTVQPPQLVNYSSSGTPSIAKPQSTSSPTASASLLTGVTGGGSSSGSGPFTSALSEGESTTSTTAAPSTVINPQGITAQAGSTAAANLANLLSGKPLIGANGQPVAQNQGVSIPVSSSGSPTVYFNAQGQPSLTPYATSSSGEQSTSSSSASPTATTSGQGAVLPDYATFGNDVNVSYNPTMSSWTGSYTQNGQEYTFTSSGMDSPQERNKVVEQLYNIIPTIPVSTPSGATAQPININLDTYGTSPSSITGGGYTTSTPLTGTSTVSVSFKDLGITPYTNVAYSPIGQPIQAKVPSIKLDVNTNADGTTDILGFVTPTGISETTTVDYNGQPYNFSINNGQIEYTVGEQPPTVTNAQSAIAAAKYAAQQGQQIYSNPTTYTNQYSPLELGTGTSLISPTAQASFLKSPTASLLSSGNTASKIHQGVGSLGNLANAGSVFPQLLGSGQIAQPSNLGATIASYSASVINKASQNINSFINNLTSTQYNPAVLNSAYFKAALGSFLSTARDIATNPVSTYASIPSQYLQVMQIANSLASQGKVSPYFPDVVEALILTAPAIATAGGTLAIGAGTVVAGSIGLSAGANAGIGYLTGQKTPQEILGNLETGGFTGAFTAPLVASGILANIIESSLPDSVSPLIVKALSSIPQSSLNMAAWFTTNTALASLNHGNMPTQKELTYAAELGAVFGAIFGAAQPVSEYVSSFAPNLATRGLTRLGLASGLSGATGVGLNTVVGSPISPTTAFALSAAMPILPEVVGSPAGIAHAYGDQFITNNLLGKGFGMEVTPVSVSWTTPEGFVYADMPTYQYLRNIMPLEDILSLNPEELQSLATSNQNQINAARLKLYQTLSEPDANGKILRDAQTIVNEIKQGATTELGGQGIHITGSPDIYEQLQKNGAVGIERTGAGASGYREGFDQGFFLAPSKVIYDTEGNPIRIDRAYNYASAFGEPPTEQVSSKTIGSPYKYYGIKVQFTPEQILTINDYAELTGTQTQLDAIKSDPYTNKIAAIEYYRSYNDYAASQGDVIQSPNNAFLGSSETELTVPERGIVNKIPNSGERAYTISSNQGVFKNVPILQNAFPTTIQGNYVNAEILPTLLSKNTEATPTSSASATPSTTLTYDPLTQLELSQYAGSLGISPSALLQALPSNIRLLLNSISDPTVKQALLDSFLASGYAVSSGNPSIGYMTASQLGSPMASPSYLNSLPEQSPILSNNPYSSISEAYSTLNQLYQYGYISPQEYWSYVSYLMSLSTSPSQSYASSIMSPSEWPYGYYGYPANYKKLLSTGTVPATIFGPSNKQPVHGGAGPHYITGALQYSPDIETLLYPQLQTAGGLNYKDIYSPVIGVGFRNPAQEAQAFA